MHVHVSSVVHEIVSSILHVQFLSDGSPPNSGDPLLRGYNDLQIFNSSPTSQESTSATPSMDPHFPRTNRSPPEHKIQVDGATVSNTKGCVHLYCNIHCNSNYD